MAALQRPCRPMSSERCRDASGAAASARSVCAAAAGSSRSRERGAAGCGLPRQRVVGKSRTRARFKPDYRRALASRPALLSARLALRRTRRRARQPTRVSPRGAHARRHLSFLRREQVQRMTASRSAAASARVPRRLAAASASALSLLLLALLRACAALRHAAWLAVARATSRVPPAGGAVCPSPVARRRRDGETTVDAPGDAARCARAPASRRTARRREMTRRTRVL